MQRLPEILKRRKTLAALYDEQLGSIEWLRTPTVPPYADFNYQSYVVTLADDAPYTQVPLMQKLLEKGIATRRGLMATHLEESYRGFPVSLPRTERLSRHTVVLPLYPQMTETEQTYVIDSIRALA